MYKNEREESFCPGEGEVKTREKQAAGVLAEEFFRRNTMEKCYKMKYDGKYEIIVHYRRNGKAGL